MAEQLLPQVFRKDPPYVITYNWTDIINGLGYQTFYGFTTTDSVSTKYSLIESTTNKFSSVIDTAGAATTNAAYTKVLDVDFDLSEFNAPRIINGTAYLRMSYWAEGTSSGVYTYIIAKIRKWDGTTETEIASVQSEELNNYDVNKTLSMEIEIPLTHFNKNDQLRLTIEGWAKDAGATASSNIVISHDPQNRAGTYMNPAGDSSGLLTTRIILQMPFKIQN